MREVLLVLALVGCSPEVVRAPPVSEDAGILPDDGGCPPVPAFVPTCESPGPCAVPGVDRSGACVVEHVPGCARCLTPDCRVGTSRDGGFCCSGCWAGSACVDPSDRACGASGSLCVPCDGTKMCLDGGVCGFP